MHHPIIAKALVAERMRDARGAAVRAPVRPRARRKRPPLALLRLSRARG